jgi:hypothetical protein
VTVLDRPAVRNWTNATVILEDGRHVEVNQLGQVMQWPTSVVINIDLVRKGGYALVVDDNGTCITLSAKVNRVRRYV